MQVLVETSVFVSLRTNKLEALLESNRLLFCWYNHNILSKSDLKKKYFLTQWATFHRLTNKRVDRLVIRRESVKPLNPESWRILLIFSKFLKFTTTSWGCFLKKEVNWDNFQRSTFTQPFSVLVELKMSYFPSIASFSLNIEMSFAVHEKMLK